MERRTNLKKRTDGVSPVVGVMLMLVVTIIIAAVVATFAGGLMGSAEVTPTAVINTQIKSIDSSTGVSSGGWGLFSMEVISTTSPIYTKDLKLVTSYNVSSRDDPTVMVGNITTVTGTGNNTNYTGYYKSNATTYVYNSPLGYGPGISGTAKTYGQYATTQWFGNYTLTAGTYMQNTGASSWDSSYPTTVAEFIEHENKVNALGAILGSNWVNLKPGDEVSVNLIYVPTGGVIYSGTVVVQ
ncbi:MAG: type IV pilin N-terminal domain-containing protein [Methanocorpusculum sp.]|uniref:type IV pilin N-terminal domain-containing protein n=1 Tax=Methanocorpusculum sp. TaxID=2058474 RepID=UPI00271A9736|nr:type IV pilin N-terminal domain-containing protein [Methanocorpusculum sp.]MDO9523035.1 type IV pilin N-terminal domain-containing protein [Methanocorpusculum sp.]